VLVGGGITELPYKRYHKPTDITFDLNILEFYPISDLQNILSLTTDDKNYSLGLVDGGYNEFKGKFPKDTISGYNGRAFEVYQLKDFADYGDEISKFWLEEIKRKTNNNYSLWNKVSQYIGHRRRQDDEKYI